MFVAVSWNEQFRWSEISWMQIVTFQQVRPIQMRARKNKFYLSWVRSFLSFELQGFCYNEKKSSSQVFVLLYKFIIAFIC